MAGALDGVAEPDRRRFAAAFAAGVEAINARGKADVGEKTMLDVLIPAARLLARLAEEEVPLADLCAQMRAEAHCNMLASKDMIATKGRAYFLGERALGHIDPGCKTCEVAIGAVCDAVLAKAATSPLAQVRSLPPEEPPGLLQAARGRLA
jgi:dihydroxyacetone kinase-like protein